MIWAKAPWAFFVYEFLRLAEELGPVPADEKAEILATLERKLRK